MAEPTLKIKSKTGANVAIALDDGSESANVTTAGTELTKPFLVCAAFRQALLEGRVEFDVAQTLDAEKLVLGRAVMKALLGTLPHTILGVHGSTTTAQAVLDERKAAFNTQRTQTVALLTQSKQYGPGASHLHAAATWLLTPTAESAELAVIDQQIAVKKAAIVALDAGSASQLDTLLAELANLQALRAAALHALAMNQAQQEWLQLQPLLTAIQNAATAMNAADPASVPGAIP